MFLGEIIMEWGMKNRLSRLIQKDGKALFLPIDHGYFQGPTHCLEKPGETIKPIYQYADAIMLTRGVLRNCIDPAIEKPIIMRVSGAVSVVGEDLANESIVTSIQEILQIKRHGSFHVSIRRNKIRKQKPQQPSQTRR